MTYYKQFAEILGLELGQEFTTVEPNSKQESKDVYRIEDDGVYSAVRSNAALWGREQSTIVDRLLSGVLKVVHKPWKPSEGYTYWWYSIAWKQAIDNEFNSSIGDLLHWKVGNCFKTKEEAETKGKEIMEQIKKEYEEA